MTADEVVNNSSEDGRDGHPGTAGAEEQKATPKAQELGPLSASEGRCQGWDSKFKELGANMDKEKADTPFPSLTLV